MPAVSSSRETGHICPVHGAWIGVAPCPCRARGATEGGPPPPVGQADVAPAQARSPLQVAGFLQAGMNALLRPPVRRVQRRYEGLALSQWALYGRGPADGEGQKAFVRPMGCSPRCLSISHATTNVVNSSRGICPLRS